MTENSVATDNVVAGPSIEAIVTKLEEAIAVGQPHRDLRLTDSIRADIRLDSLALLEVLTRLEDEFDIELIDTPKTYTTDTVGALAELIQEKIAAPGADPAPQEVGHE
ncbi:acyl carrier protein [Streptomyces sp. H27-D2]|uniref:acyl carrier protein n=1 Tax=Streptomyces sp. H27-D2 TaxID=3046304 RepID=UPI002DBB6EE0|nr:phosphopantetheine-binding protein [Streptomyces sp. H27-D2]MEC4015026.1 phosphopantetheine-binding protein [Streptomyces sp. H27-D2]